MILVCEIRGVQEFGIFSILLDVGQREGIFILVTFYVFFLRGEFFDGRRQFEGWKDYEEGVWGRQLFQVNSLLEINGFRGIRGGDFSFRI